MSGPVSTWSLMEPLRPRLHRDLRIAHQHTRGQLWYVLTNPISNRVSRLSADAFRIVGRFDGERTLGRILADLRDEFGDDAPAEDDILQLVFQLRVSEALAGRLPAFLEARIPTPDAAKQSQARRAWLSPLSVRLPLLQPGRLLRRYDGFAGVVFSKWAFCVWIACIAWAGTQAGANWTELTNNVVDRVLSFENLPLTVAAFATAKLIHELGHAFAVRRWGGDVPEMGIMLLVLMPVPYVDASSAAAFPSKWARAVVGAAGMYFELFFGALAMMLWLSLSPGSVRAFMFHFMLVATITTVLFNANPLLRFDGYYIVSDLAETPNLAARASRSFWSLVQRVVLQLKDAPASPAEGHETWLLPIYAVAAFVYRITLVLTIAVFLSQEYLFMGVALAVMMAVSTALTPVVALRRFLMSSPTAKRHRRRILTVLGGTVASILGILFLIPVPLTTLSDGVVWPPVQSEVTAAQAGFVKTIHVSDAAMVMEHTPLLQLTDNDLELRVAVAEAKLAALRARYLGEAGQELVKSKMTKTEIEHAQRRLDADRERLSQLALRSPGSGVFHMISPDDWPDRFVRRGAVVGYVVRNEQLLVRALVRQDDAALSRGATPRVRIRIADMLGTTIDGVIERQVPSARDRLPSLAMSTAGGGSAAIDPGSNEGRTLQTFFEYQISLPVDRPQLRVGQRAHVLFIHGAEPLGWQAWRRLRQLFLRQLNV